MVLYGDFNLIFCSMNVGFVDLFVWFVEEWMGNGDNGLYFDMDLCGVDLNGCYELFELIIVVCIGVQVFMIFWYDDGDVVF